MRQIREEHERQHRPVTIQEKTKENDAHIACYCGKYFFEKTLDAAWDAYDQHTME